MKNQNQNYYCTYCKKSFVTSASREDHVHSSHRDKKEIKLDRPFEKSYKELLGIKKRIGDKSMTYFLEMFRKRHLWYGRENIDKD